MATDTTANEYLNMIKLGDFGTVENKELTEKELFNRIKPKVGTWAGRCYKMNLPAPYKVMNYRTLVMPEIPSAALLVLQEGVTPDPVGSLVYAEQTVRVKPYGFYSKYTDEDMIYGFDNIVGDLSESVANQGEQLLDKMAFNAWKAGTQVVAANNGLTRQDFIKIRIFLQKMTKKGAKVHAILTPEDVAELRLKYNSASANLFLDLPLNEQSVANGALYKFEGVFIEEDASDGLYYSVTTTTGEGASAVTTTTSKRYAFFYVEDEKGRQPVALISPNKGNGEFVAKALGESGEDPLNQRGSIGIKFKGLGTHIIADQCLLRAEIVANSDSGAAYGIATVQSGYLYSQAGFKPYGYDGTNVTAVSLKNQPANGKAEGDASASPAIVATSATVVESPNNNAGIGNL